MPGIAPAALDPDSTQRKRQIIHQNQDMVEVDALLVFPVPDCIAAEIHKCGRLKKHNLLVLDPPAANVAIPLGGKRNIGRLSEGVQYHKSDVVPGISVFVAYITQPYNKVFHQIGTASAYELAAAPRAARVS